MPRRTSSWPNSGGSTRRIHPRGLRSRRPHRPAYAEHARAARWQQRERVADAHIAAGGNARDHRSRAVNGEYIFDPDTEDARAGPVFAGRDDLVKRVKEAFVAFTRDVRDRGDGRVGQKGAEQAAQILDHRLAPRLLHEVNLGQGYQSMPQAHERQDVKMLARFQHDPVIGGHHEDGHIPAMGPGYHVADEIHVAWHIHNPRDPVVGQPARGKAQVDGQAALFLFRERVGFAAGKQLDKRALAMIDVRHAEHDVLAGGAMTWGGQTGPSI